MKQLVAVTERGEGDDKQSFWTRIGVAFENRDGSHTLKFDYFPTNASTTIQLRDFREREGEPQEPRSRGRERRGRR